MEDDVGKLKSAKSNSGNDTCNGNNLQQKDTSHSKLVAESHSPLTRQFIVAFGSICGSIGAGMVSGYSAVLLPQLQKDPEIPITPTEATWIASMAALPMAFGCLAGGVLMEKFGRKNAHLILCVPFVIGWIMIGFSSSLALLLTGRFLTGLCVGLLGPPGSVFIGETSEPKYRGIFLAGISLAIAIGILLSHILGTFLHWKLTAIICAIFPLLCFLILAFVPESPAWLLSKGRKDEADKAFIWLRGNGPEAMEELSDLIDKQSKSKDGQKAMTWSGIGEEMRKAQFFKPMIIILVFFFIMQFSGVNAVAFYSVSIMKDTLGKEGLDEYLATILIDVVRLVMSVVACVLLRQVGRRPLAIFSAIGTALSLFGLSMYLYITNNSGNKISWLPIVFLVGYICFISVGVVPLPWCMTGELFPLSIRGLGSGIASAFNFLVFFVVVKTGPSFFSTIGPEGAFLIYGSVAFLGCFFLYFCLPETKNRTLQQIEDAFQTPEQDAKVNEK